MLQARPGAGNETAPPETHLIVTRAPDGRYCVIYRNGGMSRRSYTPSLEQVVRQAQRAGGIPISTEDEALRQRCRDVALPLI